MCGDPRGRCRVTVRAITTDPDYPLHTTAYQPLGPSDHVQVASPYECDFRQLKDFTLVPGRLEISSNQELFDAAYSATYEAINEKYPQYIGLLHSPQKK